MIERIIAAPAPIPDRAPVTINRVRLLGADETSTPIIRSIAALIRSLPVCLVILLVGVVVYVATPVTGLGVTVLVSIAILITLAVFNLTEYMHSQSGVERQRTKLDHKLEITHENNRHEETVTAMDNDFQLKMTAIEAAIEAFGNRRVSG